MAIQVKAIEDANEQTQRVKFVEHLILMGCDRHRAEPIADAALQRVSGMPFFSAPITLPDAADDAVYSAVNSVQKVMQQNIGYFIHQVLQLELELANAKA